LKSKHILKDRIVQVEAVFEVLGPVLSENRLAESLRDLLLWKNPGDLLLADA
jgi:hypothetical protein